MKFLGTKTGLGLEAEPIPPFRLRQGYGGQADPRSGIALIIVLGILSAMVLLGVAFAITMRTERLAASAYVDVIRARNLVDAALADIVGSRMRVDLQNVFYPDWQAFPTTQTGGSGDNFLLQMGSNYVPRALLAAARDADVLVWHDIRDPLDNRLYGQYAFMVLNCSGLLDANVIAESNRTHGLHPAEISFDTSNLPEATSRASLTNLRAQIVRFENVPELDALGTSSAIVSPAAFNNAQYVNHFHVYSRFPSGYGEAGPLGANTAYDQASIAGPPRAPTGEWLWDINHIREVLSRTPNLFHSDNAQNQAAATDFVNLLVDFADSDYRPVNPGGLSFKRVPMINEIVITNSVHLEPADAPGTNDLVLTVYINIETWYPFSVAPLDSSTDFSVVLDGPLTLSQVGPAWAADLADLEPQSVDPPSFQCSPSSYRVTTLVYESRVPVGNSVQGGVAIEVAMPAIDVRVGNAVVNRVQANWPQTAFQYGGSVAGLAPNGPRGTLNPAAGRGQFSALDPRFNWDPSDARTAGGQWESVARTLGGENERLPIFEGSNPDLSDQMRYMYCGQRPFRTAAEVSYLVYDAQKPWRTVRLLGPLMASDNTHQIVSRLTAESESVVEGKVNVNTHHAPVLAAVLRDAPIQRAHNNAITTSLSGPQAMALATHINSAVASSPLGGARNPSDLASMITVSDVEGVIGAAPDIGGKFRAESILRNSHNLLGTRHNMFTIFIFTRVFPQNMEEPPSDMSLDQMVVAQQRALVVAWRDPFLTGDGANETFVRFFSWIRLLD